MKLTHVSLTARDAGALATFYKTAFGFAERRPRTRLSGEAVSRGNGLPDADILSHWLTMAERDGPFLEILEYADPVSRPLPAVNAPGWGHLAFEVSDLAATLEAVTGLGGEMQGEVVNFGTEAAPLRIVYVRDPEGNILELEERPRP